MKRSRSRHQVRTVARPFHPPHRYIPGPCMCENRVWSCRIPGVCILLCIRTINTGTAVRVPVLYTIHISELRTLSVRIYRLRATRGIALHLQYGTASVPVPGRCDVYELYQIRYCLLWLYVRTAGVLRASTLTVVPGICRPHAALSSDVMSARIAAAAAAGHTACCGLITNIKLFTWKAEEGLYPWVPGRT